MPGESRVPNKMDFWQRLKKPEPPDGGDSSPPILLFAQGLRGHEKRKYIEHKLFGRMIAFARKAPVRYCAFCVDKRYCNTPQAVEASLFEQVVACLDQNRQLFSSYRQIKVYYDNGQAQVRELLKRAFAAVGATFAENVAPGRYRLFQVADLVCTIELLKAKLDVGIPLTKSELRFFNDIRELKKNYIRPLARIRL